MRYLLDTCVVSELVKNDPDPNVLQWLEEQHEERLYLSVLTLGELEKGISKLRASKRKAKLQEWLDEDLRMRFADRWAVVDTKVASLWGQIQARAEQAGRTMPVIDGLLAATALSLKATVVTRNIDDLEVSGVEIVNPWQR